MEFNGPRVPAGFAVKIGGMSQRTRPAFQGALIGATLGAPFQGATATKRISFYEPVPARMTPSSALEAWLVWARQVDSGGTPEGLADAFFQNTWHSHSETGFARRASRIGLRAPLTGSWQNPLGMGSEALGRSLYWGLRFHGDPDEAVRWAWFDASIDHHPEAARISAALARITSLMETDVPLAEVIRVLMGLLPVGSIGHSAVHSTLQLVNQDLELDAMKPALAQALKISDGQHIALSLGAALFAMLKSRGDFESAMALAAGWGGAATAIALTTGVWAGLRSGSVPPDWLRPLGTEFVAGIGLRLDEVPATLDDWIVAVQGPEPTSGAASSILAHAPAVVEEEMAAGVGEAMPTLPTALLIHPPLPDSIRQLMNASGAQAISRVGEIQVTVEYPDGPQALPDQGTGLVLRFSNVGTEEALVDPQLEPASGWSARHKLTNFRLKPGESNAFPAVLKAPKRIERPGAAMLRLDDELIEIAMIPGQKWFQVGPFPNAEGQGWEKAYRCELILNQTEVFNGRSNLAVRWTEKTYPGTVNDLEPSFTSGEGVVYLWNRLRFPDQPAVKVVCAASSGCQVWIQRTKVLHYYDVHSIVPRPILPYCADIAPASEVEIMIKVMRAREPLQPLVLCFLAEDGSVLSPEAIGQMDR